MLGTVFREVLEDLQRESLHELAKEIQGTLRRDLNPAPPISVKRRVLCYLTYVLVLRQAHSAWRMDICHLCLPGMPATGHLVWVLVCHLATESSIVHAEIMHNRTAVGVVYRSSAPCPYPEGPCNCTNVTVNTSVHTCKPWATQRFPFGSEFAFDTTGQEEVYVWAKWDRLLALKCSYHPRNSWMTSYLTFQCKSGALDLTCAGHCC